MSDNGSQRQGESSQEPTFERGNVELRELPALGLTLGSTFGWQPNVTQEQTGSQVSDTKIVENWEDPEEEESSVGESDTQGEWEERINLICTEYGMTKPHHQAHYCRRAIKRVDEFVTNDPLKLVKGSTRYYDTIVKTFACLAIRYRQNHDSKQSGRSTPNAAQMQRSTHWGSNSNTVATTCHQKPTPSRQG